MNTTHPESATPNAATLSNRVCRGCGASGLQLVLALGAMPLANALLPEEQLSQPEPKYPLDLAFCSRCALVQVVEALPPEGIFSEYLYFSSFSDTMLRHARESAEKLRRERGLGSDSFVIEIGSNDGYLLRNFVEVGVPVLGIDPARNIACVAEEHGVPTLARFFGLEIAQSLAEQGKRADVILANNVIAHVPDVNGVIAGIQVLLKPGGVFVMEAPYVKEMVDKLEFDTIYHEHIFYYSLTALENLFQRHGLTVCDVERLPIHGGSLRVTAMHAGEAERQPAAQAMLEEEAAWGVASHEFYACFAARVDALRAQLHDLLGDLKAQGKSVAAYGASAKGSTLLNYCGIGRETLDFVADRSTFKQGLYTPGTHLPIAAPGKLLEARPDYTLLLTWNFADEIMAQQAAYREQGGRFIIPLPEPRVV